MVELKCKRKQKKVNRWSFKDALIILVGSMLIVCFVSGILVSELLYTNLHHWANFFLGIIACSASCMLFFMLFMLMQKKTVFEYYVELPSGETRKVKK